MDADVLSMKEVKKEMLIPTLDPVCKACPKVLTCRGLCLAILILEEIRDYIHEDAGHLDFTPFQQTIIDMTKVKMEAFERI